MEGEVITASSVISFVEKLEDSSAAFYKELALLFPEQETMLLSFADASKKNKRAVVRTYRETVSDALETGFAFQGLNLRRYAVEERIGEDVSRAEALEMAIRCEERAVEFYTDVARRSRSLLATIPLVFKRVARTRNRRRESLEVALRQLTTNSP